MSQAPNFAWVFPIINTVVAVFGLVLMLVMLRVHLKVLEKDVAEIKGWITESRANHAGLDRRLLQIETICKFRHEDGL